MFGGTDGDSKCRCHWVMPVPARFPKGDTEARIFGYYYTTRDSSSGGIGDGQQQALVGGDDFSRAPDEVELEEYGGIAPSTRGAETNINAIPSNSGVSGGAIAEGGLRRAGGLNLARRGVGAAKQNKISGSSSSSSDAESEEGLR